MSNRKMRGLIAFGGMLVIPLMVGAQQVRATEVITNGGFEAGGGSFTGWTYVNEVGSIVPGDWVIQSGTPSPVNGFSVPAPPDPTHAAMTDSGGSGSHLLFQDFLVPVGVTDAILSVDRFIWHRAGVFDCPPSLDFNVLF